MEQEDKLKMHMAVTRMALVNPLITEMLEALTKCRPYMHDLEHENYSDPNAGITIDPKLTDAYEWLEMAKYKAEQFLNK